MTMSTPPIIPPGLPVTPVQIISFCEKYHIDSFEFFGSSVRGTLRPDSDIDIMVTFSPGFHRTADEHFQMLDEIRELFGRKVDLVDRDEIARSQNYIRRIGMLQNLLPTHRQISYLLDILLGIRSLETFPSADKKKTGTDPSRQHEIYYHAYRYEVSRISRMASYVDPDTRALVPKMPWKSLEYVKELNILDDPAPEFINELIHQLIIAASDLEAVIPDEESFIQRISEQGYW